MAETPQKNKARAQKPVPASNLSLRSTATRRIPASTYRLQLGRALRFDEARRLVPYLEELGVTDLYISPILQVPRGSAHGYSITDPRRLNAQIGAREDFEAFAAAAARRDMGIVLGVVPNHMAANLENPWWRDVLEHGPASAYAAWFDINWSPPAPWLRGRVLLPVLDDSYGRNLERGEFTLVFGPEGFRLRYRGLELPVDPHTYSHILRPVADALVRRLGPEESRRQAAVEKFREILAAVEQMPPRTVPDTELARRRRRQAAAIRQKLWELYQGVLQKRDKGTVAFREALARRLVEMQGNRNDPGSFAAMDALIDEQVWRICHWRIAAEMINYRRFFDINDLVGMRVEKPDVFEATHALVLELAREGKVSGFRVDHVDGLHDPQGYLERLQQSLLGGVAEEQRARFYVVVEKILTGEEPLPAEWPVAGTTGYDFLSDVSGLFVDPDGLDALRTARAGFTGRRESFADVRYARQRYVLEKFFSSEVHRLGVWLGSLAEKDRHARDLPKRALEQAVVELTACLPVYRTYLRSAEVSRRDRAAILLGLREARRRNPGPGPAAYAFLRRVLLLELAAFDLPATREAWLQFARRWQQFTGGVMAKGIEDTAFYSYTVLLSLNEVGCDPEPPVAALGVEHFHERNRARCAEWPYTFLATSTHDTKRSEDVRARLHVLSELSGEWEACLNRWSQWNREAKRRAGGRLAPDPNEEILLYQTLLGAWPLDAGDVPQFQKRVQVFLVKALREAKETSDWYYPDTGYEEAVSAFAEHILRESRENRFLEDFLQFQTRIAFYGALNSLSQVLLKATSPGIPDFYQGQELWDFSLVDPDNRRPVDFARRARLLAEFKQPGAPGGPELARKLLEYWTDGRVKFYLTWKALRFRRERCELFLDGDYVPLAAAGTAQERVCAFARRVRNRWAVAVVPRMATGLVAAGRFPLGEAVWGSTSLALPRGAPARWRNALTGDILAASAGDGRHSFRLADVLRDFPVALLEGLA